MPFRLETRKDYTYELLGSDSAIGREAWLVGFVPKKKTMQTLTGRGWVDKETFDLLRLEFKPAWLPWVFLAAEEVVDRPGKAAAGHHRVFPTGAECRCPSPE